MIITKINCTVTENAIMFTVLQSTTDPCILLFGENLICLGVPSKYKNLLFFVCSINRAV